MFGDYSKYYDLFNSDKPYKKEIKFVYEWAKKPNWIFDIGCGTGEYWKYYPKKTQIYGVDKSRSMAQRGRNIMCSDITKYKHFGKFECATALFDVLNYIPNHGWWKNIPILKGNFFIFDIWDKEKVEKDGFKVTYKSVGSLTRTIEPVRYDGKSVDLKIQVLGEKVFFEEIHKMYIHSREHILRLCSDEFEVEEIKTTEKWQTWWKLKRK